jgi:hypothetical protein
MDSRPRRADFGDAAAPPGSSRNTLIRWCGSEQAASKGYTPLLETDSFLNYAMDDGTIPRHTGVTKQVYYQDRILNGLHYR